MNFGLLYFYGFKEIVASLVKGRSGGNKPRYKRFKLSARRLYAHAVERVGVIVHKYVRTVFMQIV